VNLIEKNTAFSNKCEIRDKIVTWQDIEFATSDLMLQEEVRELIDAVSKRDEAETLDGAYDIAVISLNVAYKLFRNLGFDHLESCERTKEGFDIVLNSNLSKIKPDGTIDIDENGKVMKPDTFIKPNFTDLLR